MSLLTIPESLETGPPTDTFQWAVDQFGVDDLVVTASFQNAVLVHMAATAVPGVEIVLLEPLPHAHPDNLWQVDVDQCCNIRKVEPLNRALDGKRAWITGVRRSDGSARSTTRVRSFDIGRNIVKLNPLAAFTDDEMMRYQNLHALPAHPLAERGYESIGCWPCTRPREIGQGRRSGRWAGSSKTECGIHE